ncbi:MAG: alpha-L-fucosidase [Christensenellales bacterium]|jgi:alpha-L-fucosidase
MELFTPSFDSLWEYKCPDWFRDAKFGIWSHWGAQSVPMYGDWYARHMYDEGSPQYLYHIRHYGHPSKFGYKDICALWKAENFDPDGLMDKYVKAGARYFMGQAMHHDHFFNYPSAYNDMNSTKVGPMKDICGMWAKAARERGLPFGLTEHLGATFSWWRGNKGHDNYGPYKGVPYDGNDPAYRGFYLDNYEYTTDGVPNAEAPWYSENPAWHAYWRKVIREVIDLYKPELLYSDGSLPFGNCPEAPVDDAYADGLDVVSHLYNTSIKLYGENRAVYLQKNRNPNIYSVGVLDIEKSQLPDIRPQPWHTDTCIGNWFYDVRQKFKRPGHILEMLIDIIAKNGCMLLNVLQKPDGTIDDEAEYILAELAKWFAVNAEGVYGTRPWRVSGEGESRVVIKGFTEDAVDWTERDFRFVQKDGCLYAFQFRAPRNGIAVITSLNEQEKVKRVELLGVGEIPFGQSMGVLTLRLPEKLPTPYALCYKIYL